MNDNIERVREVFTQKSTRVDTNKGDEFYKSLFEKSKARLKSLREQKPLRDIDMMEVIETEGVNRRDFMKWVSATTATLMLPPMFAPLVAEATELMNRVPVIWLEFNHALMACARNDAEHQLDDAVEHFKGKYLLFVEGSIPTAMNGNYGTIGPSGETFQEHLARLSKDAAAVVAVGTCATFGGVPAASPNPTGAVGVMDLVKGKPIVNIPACPANPANMVGVVLHYVLTGQVPELDSLLRPKFAFGYRIHDNCERRAHFDAGEFVEEWGDEGAKNNWCLYKVGCKGPMTFNNCSIIRYNDGANWPVGVGRGCIGCSEPDFWDKYAYERPMATARIKAPTGGVEKTVDEFGLGLLTATAVGIGVHAIASVVAGKKSNENEEK